MKKLSFLLLFLVSFAFALDINKATEDELIAIKGIGKVKAAAIIEYRKVHGDFKSIDDLKNVKGIGQAIVDNVKNDVKDGSKAKDKKMDKMEDKKSEVKGLKEKAKGILD